MPPLLALLAAALLVCVHLPIVLRASRAMPEHSHESLSLNAVFLLHTSPAEVAVNSVRFIGLAHDGPYYTEHMYGAPPSVT